MVGGAYRAVSIENPEAAIPSPGETFHGRDVFAPAAALLASGEARLDDLGPAMPTDELVPLILPLTGVEGPVVNGEAWWVDAFGNVQTNIGPDELAAVGAGVGDTLTVKVGSTLHNVRWVTAYGDVDEGEPLLHVDSVGLVALAVRGGRADESLNLADGVAVTITASR